MKKQKIDFLSFLGGEPEPNRELREFLDFLAFGRKENEMVPVDKFRAFTLWMLGDSYSTGRDLWYHWIGFSLSNQRDWAAELNKNSKYEIK